MTSHYSEIKELFGKPYSDLEFLLQCMATVLEENNEADLAKQIPWLSGKIPDFTGAETGGCLPGRPVIAGLAA